MKKTASPLFLAVLLAVLVFVLSFSVKAQYTGVSPVGIQAIPLVTNWNAFYITNALTNMNGVYVQNTTNYLEYDYQGTNGFSSSHISKMGLIISNNLSSGLVDAVLTIVSNSPPNAVSWYCTNWPMSTNFPGTNLEAGTPIITAGGTTLQTPFTGMWTQIAGSLSGLGWVTNTVTSNSAYSTGPPTPNPNP